MKVAVYDEKALTDLHYRTTLRTRRTPYFIRPMMNRSFGYRRLRKSEGRWVARIRTTTGHYREKTIGRADDIAQADGNRILDFHQARDAASQWFESPSHLTIRAEARPRGICEQLCLCPVGQEYTVAHAISDFVEWKRNFQAYQSFVSSISMANAYILPVVGCIPCRNLTAEQLRSVLLVVESTLVKHGSRHLHVRVDPRTLDPEARRRRRVTANNTFTLLRTALNMAYREGRIESDAAWRHVKLFPRVDRARPSALSWNEAKALVDHAQADIRRLILAALYTGCRITELYKICVGDLHSTRKALYIHPLKNYRARTIALPDEGYDFFRSVAFGQSRDAPLLVRDDGGDWNVSYVATRFRRLCRRLGYPDNIVFHSLRHTYASLLLQAGASPIVVARQLGHITMATVIKTYAHVTDDFIDIEFRTRFKPGFLSSPDLFSSGLPEGSR